jgi:tetratricopeptide (TPR) repeat protein
MRGSLLWAAALVACALARSSGAAAQRASTHELASGSGQASGQAESSYDALIREALSEFNASNFAEARALFERAHALKPNARTLRGLGITGFELKRYVESLHDLQAALVEARNPLTDAQRTDVQALIVKARRFVGKIKLELTPSDANVLLDGQPSASAELMLDLGEHQVLVQAPGYRDAELKLMIDGGEEVSKRVALARVDLALNPRGTAVGAAEDRRVGLTHEDRGGVATGGTVFGKWWFWTAAGVVVAGAVVGTALALGGGGGGQQPLYQGSAGSLRGP